MSIINYAQKEISFKVVYYGTGVAGKTANLQYIYRGLPDVNRGNMVSLATGDDRTLFFDFLPIEAMSFRTTFSGGVPNDVVSPVSTMKSTSKPSAICLANSRPSGERWMSEMWSTRISPASPTGLVWIDV